MLHVIGPIDFAIYLPRVWTRAPSTYESIPSVRIVTGTLRGRRIASSRLGNLRLTSSRLKESIFAMLGPDLKGNHFLDLCAGSGQIGLEALSRGAHVVFNEPDRRRYSILRSILREWKVGAQMFDTRAEMLIPRLHEETRSFDTIYLDPPYHVCHGGEPLSLALLGKMSITPLLRTEGLILAQHQIELELPEEIGALQRLKAREYGNTRLSIYALS